MTTQHMGPKPWRADGYGAQAHLCSRIHDTLDAGALAAGSCRALVRHPADTIVLLAAAAVRPKLDAPFACIDAIIGRASNASQPLAAPMLPWRGRWAPAVVPIYLLMQSASFVGAGIKALLLVGASMVALAAIALTACRQGPLPALDKVQQSLGAALMQTSLQQLEALDLPMLLTGLTQAWHIHGMAEPGPQRLGSVAQWALKALAGHLSAINFDDPLPSLAALFAQLKQMPKVVEALESDPSKLGSGMPVLQLLGPTKQVLLALLQKIPSAGTADGLANEEVLTWGIKALDLFIAGVDWTAVTQKFSNHDLGDTKALQAAMVRALKAFDQENWLSHLTAVFAAIDASSAEWSDTIHSGAHKMPPRLSLVLQVYAQHVQEAFVGQRAIDLNQTLVNAVDDCSKSEFAQNIENLAAWLGQVIKIAAGTNLDTAPFESLAQDGQQASSSTVAECIWNCVSEILQIPPLMSPSKINAARKWPDSSLCLKESQAKQLALLEAAIGFTRPIDAAPGLPPYTPASARCAPLLSYDETTFFYSCEDELIDAQAKINALQSQPLGCSQDTTRPADAEPHEDALLRLKIKRDLKNAIIQDGDASLVGSVYGPLIDILMRDRRTEKVPAHRKGRLNTRKAVQSIFAHQATGIQKNYLYIDRQKPAEFTPPSVVFDFVLPQLRIWEYASVLRAVSDLACGVRGHRPEHIRMVTILNSIVEKLNKEFKWREGETRSSFSDRYSRITCNYLSAYLCEAARSPLQPESEQPPIFTQYRNTLIAGIIADEPGDLVSRRRRSYTGYKHDKSAAEKRRSGPIIALHAFTAQIAPIFTAQARLIETSMPNVRFCGIVLGGEQTVYDDPDHRMVRVQNPEELQGALVELFDGAMDILAHLTDE